MHLSFFSSLKPMIRLKIEIRSIIRVLALISIKLDDLNFLYCINHIIYVLLEHIFLAPITHLYMIFMTMLVQCTCALTHYLTLTWSMWASIFISFVINIKMVISCCSCLVKRLTIRCFDKTTIMSSLSFSQDQNWNLLLELHFEGTC